MVGTRGSGARPQLSWSPRAGRPLRTVRHPGRASPDHIRGRPSPYARRPADPPADGTQKTFGCLPVPPGVAVSLGRLPRPSPHRPRVGPRSPGRPRGPVRCSLSAPGYGLPPQIRQVFPVHILGTAKLSRSCPQGCPMGHYQARSIGCGFVDKRSPQAVDEAVIHRLWTKFSTGNPQAAVGCPQRSSASPHACPLFGNTRPLLTGSSERRHIKVPRGPVGKTGKPGDEAGENSALPVHGVCRTFCSPQKPRVVHRLHPQGQWTKSRL